MRFIKRFPTKEELLAIDALLFSVYGLEPKDVKDMKLANILKKIKLAQNDLTWIQAYKFTSLMESKPRTLWQKILSKIKH
jgi:hypothetical protein